MIQHLPERARAIAQAQNWSDEALIIHLLGFILKKPDQAERLSDYLAGIATEENEAGLEVPDIPELTEAFFRKAVLTKPGEDILDAPQKLKQPYVTAARDKHHRDGELEIDDTPEVSFGDDPGAYVQCWVWVPDEDLP